ncbi:DUF3344 domain-containing protein [Streptomyces venezuelae]|uniref:DUF3344 domain-containing protein n=1 Tax=Streptomyces venezuelae TaxID=54571 RepID=A0A5P2CK99_STRVZ|nr:DUF3344 domain-containing protein [Streptomyces venezuelae]QES42883.1 DUF3344 domain-containing protein [Streptomyces venezuelae]
MRHSLGLRRMFVIPLALAACLAATGTGSAAPPGDGDRSGEKSTERTRIDFAQRYRAVQHGGIVRAANSAITCRRAVDRTAESCARTRGGRPGANDDFDMFYVDVDDDPNTYNSSTGEVRLPPHSRVSYARLYWGGNLRVGEQKPPKDNGRVLIAEPGGHYKPVIADTPVGHRVTDGADAFQASADVTPLVRSAGGGAYTVAQVNVAKGHSKAGAWGGWTLAVAYENAAEPLRALAVYDGFDATGEHGTRHAVRLRGVPGGTAGTVGVVAYDGDRGRRGDTVAVSSGPTGPVPLTDAANPAGDALNSTISEPGAPARRNPAHPNTLGYDSDVFPLAAGHGRRGDLTVHLASRDPAWVGVVFAAVAAKR